MVVDKKYLCVFKGVKGDVAGFRSSMERFGLDPEFLDGLLARAPVVIKRDVELRQARRYADILQDAGGIVSIVENGVFPASKATKRHRSGRPIMPFEAFAMCPRCGFKQTESPRCVKCGLIFSGLKR